MRILFLTTAHNSLSQRLWIELGDLGHEIRVCVAATGEAMIAAVSREAPDLIIAPLRPPPSDYRGDERGRSNSIVLYQQITGMSKN